MLRHCGVRSHASAPATGPHLAFPGMRVTGNERNWGGGVAGPSCDGFAITGWAHETRPSALERPSAQPKDVKARDTPPKPRKHSCRGACPFFTPGWVAGAEALKRAGGWHSITRQCPKSNLLHRKSKSDLFHSPTGGQGTHCRDSVFNGMQ